MIEIKVVAKDGKIESKYNVDNDTKLVDVAMALLEIEKISNLLLEEVENYDSIMEITERGKK